MLHETLTLTSSGGSPTALDIYCPAAQGADAPRPGIVICPGGAYAFLADCENEPVALRFAGLGFNTYVVHYRTAPDRFPCALQDVAAAVMHVRRNAARYHQHPDQIALMGFSAGGHAACSLGVMWPRAELWEAIDGSPEDVQPNALVLCYPVITGGEHTHRFSMENLTGTADERVHEQYSLEKLVTDKTPPAFLWTTWDDPHVPSQNTLLLAAALRAHSIPAEVHIYPHGAHGLSLGDESTWGGNPDLLEPAVTGWPELASRFLKDTFSQKG